MNTFYVVTRNWLDQRLGCDRGAAVIEYALLMALIVLVCIVGVVFFGDTVLGIFSEPAAEFPTTQP